MTSVTVKGRTTIPTGVNRKERDVIDERPLGIVDGRTVQPHATLLADASAVVATVGVAALCWVVALQQMQGMNMGVATTLGSLSFFVAAWVSMMAAMMLPGALPAALRSARVSGRLGAAPLFAASYLAVWTMVGRVVYTVYQPHSTRVAGVLTIAAGLYELTPIKQAFRRRCRANRSGFGFGLNCVSSSAGLMLLFLAVGVMSITWMCVVALLVLAQKLLAPRAAIDVPVALAIIGLGVAITVVPSAVPGLMPMM
jgi:predicted metal-binding membrane protein